MNTNINGHRKLHEWSLETIGGNYNYGRQALPCTTKPVITRAAHWSMRAWSERITIPLVLMSRLIAAKLMPKLQRARTNKHARANSMPQRSIQLEHKCFTTKASPSQHKLSLICKHSYKARADRAVQRSPNQRIACGRPLLSASFSCCGWEMTTLAFVKPTTTQ